MSKISEYPADSAPEAADIIPLVDVSAGATENVTVANLAASAPFAAQYAPLNSTPTLEELTVSAHLTLTISTSTSYGIWVAPFACTVEQASFVTWNNNIAADNTNYWTIQLARYRADTSAIICTKTTKVTGGQALPRRTDWNFDALVFDSSNKVFAKGDILGVLTIPTGSPTALAQACLSARIVPT